MGDVDHVGVRGNVLVLDQHGTETRVVSSVPRAWDLEDETTALSTVGTWLAVTAASVTGGGDGRSGTNVVGDLGVVVQHEVDLNIAGRGRVDPVDGNLCARLPEDVAAVEVTSRVVHDELRVGVLVLTDLELLHRGGSNQRWCGESGGNGQGLCDSSHRCMYVCMRGGGLGFANGTRERKEGDRGLKVDVGKEVLVRKEDALKDRW